MMSAKSLSRMIFMGIATGLGSNQAGSNQAPIDRDQAINAMTDHESTIYYVSSSRKERDIDIDHE